MQRKPKTVNRRTSFGHPSIQKGNAIKLGSQKTADRIAVATATCDPQGGEGQKGGVGKARQRHHMEKIAFGRALVPPSCSALHGHGPLTCASPSSVGRILIREGRVTIDQTFVRLPLWSYSQLSTLVLAGCTSFPSSVQTFRARASSSTYYY